MVPTMDVVAWLLDSDPAIRWQTMRDLTGAAPVDVATERRRVAGGPLGAAILARQAADGVWRKPGAPDWLPTLYTVQLLRAIGVDPSDALVGAAMARLAEGFRWHEEVGGRPFFEGEVEPCLNGGTLAAGGYFGRISPALVERLLREQLADGGWNCDAPGSARSSFHSTICVLEGLLECERAAGSPAEVAAARRRGEDYLLERRLFRRRSTGEVVDPTFLECAFPGRYNYDVLRALDHLRAAGAQPDERVDEAIGVVRHRQQADGRWLLDACYAEPFDFAFPEAVGEPSRWITLRALRVLRWYEEGRR
jgi:hypothetical protein